MITDFSFGRIAANGQFFNSDIKIVCGTLVPEWWRRNGHTVEIEDIQDILDSDSEILVIGQGQPGYMRTADALKKQLAQHGIALIEEPTATAVETYNRLLAEGRKISGGFHVGC
jgi:hypothetical protein